MTFSPRDSRLCQKPGPVLLGRFNAFSSTRAFLVLVANLRRNEILNWILSIGQMVLAFGQRPINRIGVQWFEMHFTLLT